MGAIPRIKCIQGITKLAYFVRRRRYPKRLLGWIDEWAAGWFVGLRAQAVVLAFRGSQRVGGP